MSKDKDMCEALAAALAARLGGKWPEPGPVEPAWKNVRSRVATDQKGAFVDFGMGGGHDGAEFTTALNGRLAIRGEADAFAYFKVRIAGGEARLELHTMAADWHEGTATDPRNIEARRTLARLLASVALPKPWVVGHDKDIEDLKNRSSMVWKWGEWQRLGGDVENLANRIADAVRAIRPLLVAAVGG